MQKLYGNLMNCKYKQEQELLYTYEEDIHPLERSIKAFETGICISPSLDYNNLLFIINKFKIRLDNKNILNLGAGHGILDLLLAKNFNVNITAIEFSKNRIDRCNYLKQKYKINNVNFIHEDIHNYLDNLEHSYDIIIATEVIEHLYNQEEVITKCKAHSDIFFGTIPIQPNCQQKQHISYFKSIKEAKDIFKCDIYNQSIVKLRLPECVLFYNNSCH